MLIQCLVSQLVQLPSTYIAVQLLIPGFGVKFGEPLAETRQLIGWELGNSRFDFVERVHTNSLDLAPIFVNAGAESLAQLVARPSPPVPKKIVSTTGYSTNVTAR